MVAHVTENGRMPHDAECKYCGIVYTVYVDPVDFAQWTFGGGFIQDLMPYLSAGERELLITGTCGSCFDRIFGLDTDEE